MTVLRFPLIVLVVFFHAYTASVDLAGGGIAGSQQVDPVSAFVRIFVSKGFGNLAVPLFFLVSGFLFFQKYDGSWATYKEKLSRRVKTLLIPFLIWNFATYLVYFAGESIPATKVYFATKYWPPIRSFTALDYANAFFGFTVKFPMSYQFWFIRDLMVMVVLSPLIYLLLKRRAVAIPFLTIMLALWMTGYWPLVVPGSETLLFFIAGCYIASKNMDPTRPDPWIVPLGVGFGSLLLLVDVLMITTQTNPEVLRLIVNSMMLFGLPFAWGLTKWAVDRPKWRSPLERLAEASFFVYAAHEPLLSILRKVSFRLIQPHSTVSELLLFFLVPIAVIVFLVAVYTILNRALPRFTAVITGAEGRQWRAKESQGNPAQAGSPKTEGGEAVTLRPSLETESMSR
nr:acyltransferase [Granulicella aggregans]